MEEVIEKILDFLLNFLIVILMIPLMMIHIPLTFWQDKQDRLRINKEIKI